MNSERDAARRIGSPRSTGWTLAVALGLVAVVFGIYGQTAGHGFVAWDDDTYVYANSQVQAGLTAGSARWAFTTAHASNWHPLTWLSHMLDVEIFGDWAGGHHLTSVALHAANAVLLFLALRFMTGALWTSALVAALFAVHPLRVESVAWVSERKDVLSGLFWIGGMWAYAFYARRPGPALYAGVWVLLALGLAAKPMLVTLPFVFLLLDYWPLGRLRHARSAAGEVGQGTALPRLVVEKLPLLGLAALSSVATVLAQRGGGAVGSLEALAWSARFLHAPLAYVAYLRQTLWPSALACLYPHPALQADYDAGAWVAGSLGATVLLALATFACVRWRRERPYLAVGWLWYLGTLVPVIGLFQVGMQARADRYAYLPLIGIYLLAAWGLRDLVRAHPGLRRPAAAVAIVVLAAFGWVASRQVTTWRDSRTLFEHALRVTSGNFLIHNNLGNEMARRGELDEAAAQLEAALRIRPGYVKGLGNLGNVYARRGELGRAEALFREALRLDPTYVTARLNLALALQTQGDLDGAIREYRTLLDRDPNQAQARLRIGELLLASGDPAAARQHLLVALQRFPDDTRTLKALGQAEEQLGDLSAAAQRYERAARVDPSDDAAQNALGIVFAKQARWSEAIARFEAALRLNPRNADARRNLERAARLGRPSP